MHIYTKILFLFLLTILSLQAKQKVLILHSYHETYKWTDDINKGIYSILDKHDSNIEFYIEYMDTKRYSTQEHYNNLLTFYKSKYDNISFDLILSSDNNAFNFLKEQNNKIFNNTPILFCGVNYLKAENIKELVNFSGVNEEINLKKNYELIKTLHPNIKNIYTIADNTTTGKSIKEEIKKVIKEFSDNGINYEIISDITLTEFKNKISNLPKNSAILLSVFFKTKDGHFFESDEVVNFIKINSKNPLYAISDFYLGNGINGGYLVSGFYQGQEVAKMAKEVLLGANIKDIKPLFTSPNHYMFDYKELITNDIDLDLLPKESSIINKPTTFFFVYKKTTILLVFLSIILVLFIFTLILNIKKKKIEKEKLNKQLVFQQNLIDKIQIPIYYKNLEAKYIGCNKAFEDLINMQKKEILNKNIFSLTEKNFPNIFEKNDQTLLKSGLKQKYEVEHINFNGEKKDIVLYKNVFYDKNKKIAGLVGIIFDITKLKQIIQKQDLLENNNNIEIKNELFICNKLVAGITSEMTTPVGDTLNSITTLIEDTVMIQKNYKKNIIIDDNFESLISKAKNLEYIINANILKISELIKSFKQLIEYKNSEEYEIINVKDTIEKTLLDIKTQNKEKDLNVEIICDDNINIKTYSNLFDKVFIELFSNTIIHGYKHDSKIDILIKVIKNDKELTIIFKDKGIGIHEYYLKKVFEPFFTTNKNEGNIGIGLSIIYNIVTKILNGSIKCKSKPLKGSEFTILLPL